MKGTELLSKACHKSKLYLKKNSSTILTCIGVIGVVATTVMAVRETPKAVELIAADSRHNHDGDPFAYTKLEAVQSCWKCYIPAALVGLSTIACIIGINAFNKRNQASLMSAYAMLSESYRQYRDAAKTVYGADADARIIDQMAKDMYIHHEGYSVYSSDLDSLSEKILCYDLYSRRYFEATMAAVLNAEYHVNRNFCLGADVSVNQFYEFLGIDGIENGDEIMWGNEEMLTGGIEWLDFENRHTVMDDGMECCVIAALWDPNKFDISEE